MSTDIYRVKFSGGACGEYLIRANGVIDAITRMQAYFAKTPGFGACLILAVEWLGPLWSEI